MGLFDAHDEAVFADGKSNAWRGDTRAQGFRESIITATAQHGILSAERTMGDLKRSAHVVVESAHQTRANFESNAAAVQMILHHAEMLVAIGAKVIQD